MLWPGPVSAVAAASCCCCCWAWSCLTNWTRSTIPRAWSADSAHRSRSSRAYSRRWAHSFGGHFSIHCSMVVACFSVSNALAAASSSLPMAACYKFYLWQIFGCVRILAASTWARTFESRNSSSLGQRIGPRSRRREHFLRWKFKIAVHVEASYER